MSNDMRRCSECGTTIISFDPPLVFEPQEACGDIKPGTYAQIPGGIPFCERPRGHEGNHVYLVEYLTEWTDGMERTTPVAASNELRERIEAALAEYIEEHGSGDEHPVDMTRDITELVIRHIEGWVKLP